MPDDVHPPPAPEPPLLCACGCGDPLLSPTDAYGRPRRFLPGHNLRVPRRRVKPSRAAVLFALMTGPATPSELAERLRISVSAARFQLSRLRTEGLSEPTRRGVWALTSPETAREDSPDRQDPTTPCQEKSDKSR